MGSRNDFINQALSWAGRNEDDGSFRVIIDTYNGHKPLARGYRLKYSDEWCACFVSACAIASGNAGNVPLEVSCPKMIAIARTWNIWKESDSYKPQPGDIIMYDWQDMGTGDNRGVADHVGVVVYVNGDNIKIIEGNRGRKVAYRTISRNGRYIRGYITPNFSNESMPKVPATNSLVFLASEVIAGRHGNGNARADSIYDRVQEQVNLKLKGRPVIRELRQVVDDVIAGKYGNGEIRRRNLYQAVQNEVNRRCQK